MFDFHSDFYFQFFSRDQVGWGLVEFSKVLMIIIIMKPSRYLKGYSAKTCIETTNSKTRSKKFWNNIQIIILFESLELHQRFKMRLCYVTERLFRISKGVMYMARRSIPFSHSERVWWRWPPWREAWWCDLRQLWVDVMLCHNLFRGFGFAVLLFLIKSTRDYLKAKNVATTVIYAILDNGLRIMLRGKLQRGMV